MPLDTSIISQATFQPIQFKSPDRVNMLLQAAQAAQAVQGLEAGQEERQARIAGQQRAAQTQAALQEARKLGYTDEGMLAMSDALIGSGVPDFVNKGVTLRESLREAKRFRDALAQTDGAPVAAPGMQPVAGGAPGMTAAPGAAPANAMAAPVNAPNQLAGRAAPPDIRALLSIGTPQAMQAANALMEQYKLGQPKEAAGPEIVQLMRARDALPPGSPDRALLDERIKRLNAPSQPMIKMEMPVPVYNPQTGQVQYVTREAALGQTPAANAPVPVMDPKEIQKREASFPQARQAVTTVGKTMKTIVETIDRLLANKSGLNGVTGLVYGRTPAVTAEARKADADLEQLANLAFVQGITELRAASKTGAGVGNVSNKEGDRFENLKASLKRTQSTADMEAALKRLREQADFTGKSLDDAFADTYEYRNSDWYKNAAPAGAGIRQAPSGGAPAPATGGGWSVVR